MIFLKFNQNFLSKKIFPETISKLFTDRCCCYRMLLFFSLCLSTCTIYCSKAVADVLIVNTKSQPTCFSPQLLVICHQNDWLRLRVTNHLYSFAHPIFPSSHFLIIEVDNLFSDWFFTRPVQASSKGGTALCFCLYIH